MYARGILFGKMKYELGDHAYIRCPETGLSADIEFKVKGWVSGGYDAIGGSIKDANDKTLFELSGTWNGAMYIKDLATGKKELLFDATNAKETPPSTRPLSEQTDRESQKLWAKVTAAIKKRDQNTATDEKAKIEDRQREEAAERADNGVDWQPSLFRRVRGGRGGSEEGEEDLEWILNAKIDGRTPEEQTKQILQVAAILPGQTPERRFSIPERHLHSDQAHPGNQQQAQPTYQQQTQPTYQQQAQPMNQQQVQPAYQQQALPIYGQQAQPMYQQQTQPPAPQQRHYHGDLIDFGHHNDQRYVPQQQPLGQTHVLQSQPAHPPGSNRLARKDSETADVDEFVDAES
ncbi:Oxysterol-binding protein OBPa [Coniosporium apollinis]|uniref:Oxysterol-binding protein OBPa n=1 Tax=Coniosporium apollinis TaxID=61459 RepID=A0ABQ9NPV6_9PEZI|nr:Oxysterol-binding protein OBPa [Coniosporium apollinis]